MSNSETGSVNEAQTHFFINLIDRFIIFIGRGIAWLSLPIIVIIVLQVILRYGFSRGLVALEEMQWHLYAILVIFAVAYGVTEDIHIRMDLLYQGFSIKTKTWVDLIGLTVFALPVALFLCVYGMELVQSSFHVLEGSAAPGGLPYRWIIKAVLPIGMGLYALSIASRIARIVIYIFCSMEDKTDGI